MKCARYFVPLGNWSFRLASPRNSKQTTVDGEGLARERDDGNGNRKSNWDYFETTWSSPTEEAKKNRPLPKKRDTANKNVAFWCIPIWFNVFKMNIGSVLMAHQRYFHFFWLHSTKTHIHILLTNYGSIRSARNHYDVYELMVVIHKFISSPFWAETNTDKTNK